MGRKPEEVIKDAVLMIDVKMTEKDEKGYVSIKASKLAELTQALRDSGMCY
jgi:hypothetical protein